MHYNELYTFFSIKYGVPFIFATKTPLALNVGYPCTTLPFYTLYYRQNGLSSLCLTSGKNYTTLLFELLFNDKVINVENPKFRISVLYYMYRTGFSSKYIYISKNICKYDLSMLLLWFFFITLLKKLSNVELQNFVFTLNLGGRLNSTFFVHA